MNYKVVIKQKITFCKHNIRWWPQCRGNTLSSPWWCYIVVSISRLHTSATPSTRLLLPRNKTASKGDSYSCPSVHVTAWCRGQTLSPLPSPCFPFTSLYRFYQDGRDEMKIGVKLFSGGFREKIIYYIFTCLEGNWFYGAESFEELHFILSVPKFNYRVSSARWVQLTYFFENHLNKTSGKTRRNSTGDCFVSYLNHFLLSLSQNSDLNTFYFRAGVKLKNLEAIHIYIYIYIYICVCVCVCVWKLCEN